MFFEAKYFICSASLKNNDSSQLENYINEYPDSPFKKDAINRLLRHFKDKNLTVREISYFEKYIEIFSDDPWFLNQFSWRMTELNQNLELALEKTNHALNIIDGAADGIANIIDTKAEVLWKMGRADEAVETINEAILLDPENEYYHNQKNKFEEY